MPARRIKPKISLAKIKEELVRLAHKTGVESRREFYLLFRKQAIEIFKNSGMWANGLPMRLTSGQQNQLLDRVYCRGLKCQ